MLEISYFSISNLPQENKLKQCSPSIKTDICSNETEYSAKRVNPHKSIWSNHLDKGAKTFNFIFYIFILYLFLIFYKATDSDELTKRTSRG